MDRHPSPKPLWWLSCWFVLLIALPLQAGDPPAKAQKVVSIEGITEYKLANGARYLLFPDKSASTLTINMTVLVGSRHEGYGETGMAHLLEHMLFKGSPLYPAPDKALAEHGVGPADANGTTWTDRTNYYETMPASDANLEFGVKFEADRLVNCFIKREDLAKEMTVVRNEFERGENDPESILSQRMIAVAFEWHNYGKSTIGNQSDIERVPIERLQAFYRKFYQPDNIIVVLAGKFDETKAHDYLAKYFGALPRPQRKLEQTYTEEPAQDGERIVVLRRVGKVAVAGLLYHVPAAAHADNAVMDIVTSILTDVPTGRLYRALVETGKATSVNGSSTSWHDPGYLEIAARVGDKSTPEEVRDIIVAEMENIAKKPFTKEEVEKAQVRIAAQYEQLFRKSKSVALQLSEWAGAGDWRMLFLHRDRIAAATVADANRVANKYFVSANRTVGLYIPTKQVARATIPESPDVAALLKDYKGKAAIASGEDFDPTYANIEKRTERLTLDTGVKVALLPKKTRGETVTLSMVLRFGNAESLLGKGTIANFTGAMMVRGTKKYTHEQLQEKLDKLSATISVSAGLGTLSVGIQAKRQTLPEVLDLLESVLREPTFPEKELTILKNETLQQYKKALTEPNNLAFNKLQRELNPFPKDSIYYVPTIEESSERVEKVTRELLSAFYQEQLGGTVGELVVLGDFDTAPTVKKVESILTGWKSSVPYRRIPAKVDLTVKGSRHTINTPDKANAVYVAGYKMAIKDTDPQYPALELASYILGESGLNSLLFDRLRQKEGLSYGAGSRLSVDSQDEAASMSIFATCNPENVDKADKVTLEVLQGVVKNSVTDKQLTDAIKGYLTEQVNSRGKDNVIVAYLRSGLYLNRTLKFYEDFEAGVAKVTPAELRAAFQRIVLPDRMVIVRAADLSKTAKPTPQK